jgi:indole-3-glycerol phosphate synthase
MKFSLKKMESIKSKELPEVKALIREINSRRRPLYNFRDTLTDRINIISELKHSSPSAGILSGELDNDTVIIEKYIEGGASAISVLTEKVFFNGSYDHLRKASSSCGKPVLCKDFIYFEEQIDAAYLCGADMALLISRVLDKARMKKLYDKTISLGMTPLIEIHEQDEIEKVMPLNPEFILVNMRNLETLEMKINTGIDTLKKLPASVTAISASGIEIKDDIAYIMDESGTNNFLIGSALMRTGNPEAMIREFKNVC